MKPNGARLKLGLLRSGRTFCQNTTTRLDPGPISVRGVAKVLTIQTCVSLDRRAPLRVNSSIEYTARAQCSLVSNISLTGLMNSVAHLMNLVAGVLDSAVHLPDKICGALSFGALFVRLGCERGDFIHCNQIESVTRRDSGKWSELFTLCILSAETMLTRLITTRTNKRAVSSPPIAQLFGPFPQSSQRTLRDHSR